MAGRSRRSSSIDGRVEAATDGVVTGWAWDPAAPGTRVELEVLVDGAVVATATADGFHRGLVDTGVGDGCHMFRAALPADLADGAAHDVRVRAAGASAPPLPAVAPFPGFTHDPGNAFATTTFVAAGVAAAPAEQPLAALGDLRRVTVAIAGERATLRGDPGRATLDRLQLDVAGDDFTLTLGTAAALERCKIVVRGDGCAVTLAGGVRLRGAILRIEGARGRIAIGGETTMEGGALLVHEDDLVIELGRDCMLSRDVFLRTSDSHAIVDVASGERINPPGSIQLEDRVWLGAGAQIGKGVTIGAGSVVGQWAIVVKDVPSEVVVAGNPARVVRRGVTWRRDLGEPRT